MEYPPNHNKFFGANTPEETIKKTLVQYRTFDDKSIEMFRMTQKPEKVLVNNQPIPETEQTEKEGWNWKALDKGGILTVRHWNGNKVLVMGK
jgi:hypothetical protein